MNGPDQTSKNGSFAYLRNRLMIQRILAGHQRTPTLRKLLQLDSGIAVRKQFERSGKVHQWTAGPLSEPVWAPAAMSASGDDQLRGGLTSKSAATSDPTLPLVPVEQAAQLGDRLGIDRDYGDVTHISRVYSTVHRLAAGFYGLVNALFFHSKVAARMRELIILRIGWRTGSEYVFCNHLRFSRGFGIPDEDLLGVREPQHAAPTARLILLYPAC